MATIQIRRAFGNRIRFLRKKKGLTQQQLADAVDMNFNTISNIERGIALTKIETAAAIARVLDTDLSSLFCFAGSAPEDHKRHELLNRLLDLLSQQPQETVVLVFDQTENLIRHLSKRP